MQASSSRTLRGLKLLILVSVLSMVFGCKKEDVKPPKATEENADVVYSWYRFIAKLQLRASPQPVILLNNRNFGFIGVGLYESVRPGIKGAQSFSSFLYQMPPMPVTQSGKEYLWSATANAALASMFKQLLAGLTNADRVSIDSMEKANNNRFSKMVSDAVLARSQAFGRSVASAIHNWSLTDHFNLSGTGYVPPVCRSCWVPTPPAFAPVVGPYLQNSRPFLAYSLTATAPPPPIAYSEDPASEFFQAAKEVYEVGKALTSGQKAIAEWWADAGGAGVGVPAPYHMLSIITSVLEKQKAKLGKAAEMYAKTGIGLKDGPIVTFRSKFQYNLIRPITYIQRHMDPGWVSYLVNPPYPEYLSGLGGLYAPPIQVLIREFGDVPVKDDAYLWRGLPPRHYASLSKLLEEAVISRIFGGLHYRFTQNMTVTVGTALGNKIADINLAGSTKH